MTPTNKSVIVVGGGAAGMIAAIYAADYADSVVLIEKNKTLGRKIRITGKGRCNITNSAEIEDFFKNIPTNPKFLYSALYSYTNYDIISLLENCGVKTKEERGGRIFPLSDNANHVADALWDLLKGKNVRIINDEVMELIINSCSVSGVRTKSGTEYYGSVVLATGGASYPKTGSDGKMLDIAQKLGHTVVDLKPSLVPVVCSENWVHSLTGLSLKNVVLNVYDKGKLIFTELGELLFTHFGLSGPLVLSASSHMRSFDGHEYNMCIDLKPGLDEKKLDLRILRDFEEEMNRDIINGLNKLLPKALIPVVIKLSGIDERKKINSITKQERAELVRVIKNMCIKPKGFRPVDEAIITSGGISVKEINPSTMESKLYKNLYFAGEMIDVDAYTGGYNLQIAWSTGYIAGMSASGAVI